MARRYNHPAGSELPLIAVEARPVFGTELCDKKIEVAVNGTLDTDPNFDYRIDHPEKGGLSNSVKTAIKVAPRTLTFSTDNKGSISATVDGVPITSPTGVEPGALVVLTATAKSGFQFDAWSGIPSSAVIVANVATFYMPSAPVSASASFSSTWTGLTFTSEGNSTIKLTNYATSYWTFEYCTDGATWQTYTSGHVINLADGEFVFFRGEKSSISVSSQNISVYTTGSVYASGDITSLLNKVGGVSDLSAYGTYLFNQMFYACGATLKSAPNLPATTLSENCYQGMFFGCSSINEVHCGATNKTPNKCVFNWLNGVSVTGDFYGKIAAGWTTGQEGIPEGWTRHLD